jgi:hypothetical protein
MSMQFSIIANQIDDWPPFTALGTPGVAGDAEARVFGEVVSEQLDGSSVSSRNCEFKTCIQCD